jgi:hypothetical protein
MVNLEGKNRINPTSGIGQPDTFVYEDRFDDLPALEKARNEMDKSASSSQQNAHNYLLRLSIKISSLHNLLFLVMTRNHYLVDLLMLPPGRLTQLSKLFV